MFSLLVFFDVIECKKNAMIKNVMTNTVKFLLFGSLHAITFNNKKEFL